MAGFGSSELAWKKAATRIGYIAQLEGDKATLNLCSATHFPQGYTDTSGNKYDPRMYNLVIERDLGGFSLGRGSFIMETATFSIMVGGYDDQAFWSDFIDGNRLEGAYLKIYALDPEATDQFSQTPVFAGYIQPLKNGRFGPHVKTRIKALGGPAGMHRELPVEVWRYAEFEDSGSAGGALPEDGKARGVIKNLLFGAIEHFEGVIFAAGNTATPSMTLASDRALGFGYRISGDEPAWGGTWVYPSNIWLIGKTSGNKVVENYTATTDTTKSAYTEVLGAETRHQPYVIFNDITLVVNFNPEWDRDQSSWGDSITDNAFYTDRVMDILVWSSKGMLRIDLVTGNFRRDGTDWTTFTTETNVANYGIATAIPGVRQHKYGDTDVPTTHEVLAELFWLTGRDAWWDFSAGSVGGDPIWTMRVAKRSVAAADVTLGRHDIKENSLQWVIDPKREYGNHITIQGALRYGPPDPTDNREPAERRMSKTKKIAAEVTAIGHAVRKKHTMKWASYNSGSRANFENMADDRIDDLAQRQVWFEWTSPIFWHPVYDDSGRGMDLHTRVQFFGVGDFPDDIAQIRKLRIDYDKAEIKYSAAAVSPNYAAG